ncbi:MAG: glycerol-3-phosphate 1-O-acyltransferase PlsY [Oscillospiraceae bacterium]|jgi:glycerol-3-phosphate acyltransferase PlsY|nr:glycerol-3-phosphate 1-O-acyltransferase PlsY [Oscillospiraceae bacterium]
MFLFLIIATALPSYLLGSVNGAIIMSKLFYRKDIRDYGSGNPGLTNFFRVFGKGGVILVVFIDVIKTITPVILGGWLFAHFTDMYISEVWGIWPFNRFFNEAFFGQAVAGFFVMLGHCYPVFHKFKGGKGVMAIGAIVIVIDWRLALISWGVFIIITLLTRYVSLGAMLGSTAFPLSMLLLDIGGIAELNIIILCVLLVVFRHSPNIKRLVKGEESKLKFKRGDG